MSHESRVDVFDVLDGGPFTTVQDRGRVGSQRYGVPVSGALDLFALRVGNLLVGNDEGAAGLEMTVAGPRLAVVADTVVAVTGADLQPRADGALVPMWQAVPLARGSVLSFRGRRAGVRSYLAVAGGLDVPLVLGSRSTYVRSRLGGLDGRPLRPGDRLPVPADPARVAARRVRPADVPICGASRTLRVMPGPQDSAFPADALRTFFSSTYTISSQSDRMGFRLEGPAIRHRAGADIVSDGSPPGAVQVTGDGLPIILLADRGTIGGYTKVATVVSADLPRLAQMAPGDQVRFRAVGRTEALAARAGLESIVARVRDAPLRLFTRRRYRVVSDGIEYGAIGGFVEEDPGGETAPLAALDLEIDGRPYRVEQSRVDRMPGRLPATDRGNAPAAVPRTVAAAVAAARARETPPRDYPLVI